MNPLSETICFIAPVILPIILSLSTFFDRRRVYAAWAKVASIVVCIAGLGWWSLHLVLLHWSSLHLSRETYYQLVALKGILFGLAAGFSISILMARPYQMRNPEKPERNADPVA
jgi:hypothetical protein